MTISAACAREVLSPPVHGPATVAGPCDLGFSWVEVNRDASCLPAASSTMSAFSSA